MSKSYAAECPFCEEDFEIIIETDAEQKELTDDLGCVSECLVCGEDVELDYDPATDTLTVTPGQTADEPSSDDEFSAAADDETEEEEEA